MNQKPVKDLEAWFWFYKENVKNYAGLNFTARSSACDVLTECLANWNPELQRKRAFNLPELDPKDEAKVSGGQKFRCFRKLRLIWSDEPVGISIFQDREERLIELTFDAASVATLLRITRRSRRDGEICRLAS